MCCSHWSRRTRLFSNTKVLPRVLTKLSIHLRSLSNCPGVPGKDCTPSSLITSSKLNRVKISSLLWLHRSKFYADDFALYNAQVLLCRSRRKRLAGTTCHGFQLLRCQDVPGHNHNFSKTRFFYGLPVGLCGNRPCQTSCPIFLKSLPLM